MKKRIIAALTALVILLSITGCTPQKQSQKDNVEISMYLWDKAMCRYLTPWLEKQFPDIDFTFVVGYNTMDFYSDLNSRGSLPDIITCRRFSLNDAAHMSDMLMDLSGTDLAGSFYDNYLENNREPDGAIRWLPMCAEVDGYVANKDLFEEYNIPLPTNYEEFAQACRLFESQGIAGYINDYREDYSCMEALQGCAIPELMTMEGVTWRIKYENETAGERVGLDDKVWPEVFEKFEKYIKDTMLKPEYLDMFFASAKDSLVNGKAAIMRATAGDCANIKKEYGINTVMLPYFGKTSDDNWLLTYPSCQVAVNKSLEQDAEKAQAVIQVLEAMFSEEGQRKMSTGNAVLTYNKNVNIEMNDVFSEVEDCVNSNHLYIRLASAEMFSTSKDVVQKMINGEYDAQQAYDEFNTQISAVKDKKPQDIVTTQQTGYDYAFGEHGSPAASAVVNTILNQKGADVAIGYSNVITAPVFEGDYTAQQLNWLLANRVELRQGQLTGAETVQLMEWLVNVNEDGNNPVRHSNLLPITGGMEYTAIDNGDGTFTLDKLTVNGEQLNENAVYTVIMLGENDFIQAPHLCGCPMPEQLKEKMNVADDSAYALLAEALSGNQQMQEPSEYITLNN